ncbi:aspartate/glutamate racemase family protein [Micromonospora sp. NPDC023966]|uniref:aspartate/glutamate racemase family protein n=1 Tax=Micromonospora sp. NPDC023966 TaxID=3154699 RepID=UPI003407B683
MRVLLIMNGSRARYAGGADEARLRVWQPYCAPGTQLEIGYLPDEDSSGGVARNYEFGAADAAIKQAVLYPERCAQAEQEGYDAVIMHCCSDPGLERARARVSIPVIGPGEATLRAGAMLGRAIGMTVPSDKSVKHHREQVTELGLDDRLLGVEPINRPIGAYAGQDPRAMTDALVAAAQRLVDRGADVICPTGLAFIPVRVAAAEVARRVGVPVLDPALLAVRATEALVASVAPVRTPRRG